MGVSETFRLAYSTFAQIASAFFYEGDVRITGELDIFGKKLAIGEEVAYIVVKRNVSQRSTRMAVTIKDIARKLNISVSTVSYALNGGPRPVPAAVKEQVLEAAKELNYRPNRLAKSMVTGRSNTVGIVPPVVSEDAFLSPYLQLALNGIVNKAAELHQDVLLYTRYNLSEHEEFLSNLVDGRVDGIMFIAPQMDQETIELATSLHLPCVSVSGVPLKGVLSFCSANGTGIRQALDHLWDLGHRKIGHLAGRLDMQDALVRLQAYQEFLKEKGLVYREDWVGMGQFLIEGGYEATKRILAMEDRPTALLCANDEMAVGALRAGHEAGLKMPEELSVVGFDGSPSAIHVYPTLTTVRQPIGEMGQAAMQALYDLIEGREVGGNQVFETELIIRGSTLSNGEQS